MIATMKGWNSRIARRLQQEWAERQGSQHSRRITDSSIRRSDDLKRPSALSLKGEQPPRIANELARLAMTLQPRLIVNSVLQVLEGQETLKDTSATVSGAGKQEKCASDTAPISPTFKWDGIISH